MELPNKLGRLDITFVYKSNKSYRKFFTYIKNTAFNFRFVNVHNTVPNTVLLIRALEIFHIY